MRLTFEDRLKMCEDHVLRGKSLSHICEENGNYDGTKTVLRILLEEHKEFSDDILTKIVDEYIEKCESNQIFPWEYYFIKYSSFRPGRYGKYYWRNYTDKKYELSVMFTTSKLSSNAYQTFFFVQIGKLFLYSKIS